MPKSIQLVETIPNGAKAQDAVWITPTDKLIDDIGKWRTNIAIDIDARVQYTVDGTTWLFINEGNDLKAGCSYGFDIYVRAGDLVNFRTPDTGVTLLLGRMDSIKDEG